MFLLCEFTSAVLFRVKYAACLVTLFVRVVRWLHWYTVKFSMTLFISVGDKKTIIHTLCHWKSSTVYSMVG